LGLGIPRAHTSGPRVACTAYRGASQIGVVRSCRVLDQHLRATRSKSSLAIRSLDCRCHRAQGATAKGGNAAEVAFVVPLGTYQGALCNCLNAFQRLPYLVSWGGLRGEAGATVRN